MTERGHKPYDIDRHVTDRPVTLTLRLSSADVELAMSSGGASLCQHTMKALVLAQVFDLDVVEY